LTALDVVDVERTGAETQIKRRRLREARLTAGAAHRSRVSGVSTVICGTHETRDGAADGFKRDACATAGAIDRVDADVMSERAPLAGMG
jgi:hypothetical protein